MTIAMADFSRPVFWAVLIGWILTVVLHELSHGIVAYLGGDYTIRERGGLTLNPLQYIDPLGSIILPAVFLAIGGIPLPGGVTYIDRSLLRSRVWESAVALAGPASNFILFLLFALSMHPAVGWVKRPDFGEPLTPAQMFLGAMTTLQFFSTIFNLFPVPPLDGFQFVMPWLGKKAENLAKPPISTACYVGLFMILSGGGSLHLATRMFSACGDVLRFIGYDEASINFVRVCFNNAMFGSSN